jgi:hypothetical protein
VAARVGARAAVKSLRSPLAIVVMTVTLLATFGAVYILDRVMTHFVEPLLFKCVSNPLQVASDDMLVTACSHLLAARASYAWYRDSIEAFNQHAISNPIQAVLRFWAMTDFDRIWQMGQFVKLAFWALGWNHFVAFGVALLLYRAFRYAFVSTRAYATVQVFERQPVKFLDVGASVLCNINGVNVQAAPVAGMRDVYVKLPGSLLNQVIGEEAAVVGSSPIRCDKFSCGIVRFVTENDVVVGGAFRVDEHLIMCLHVYEVLATTPMWVVNPGNNKRAPFNTNDHDVIVMAAKPVDIVVLKPVDSWFASIGMKSLKWASPTAAPMGHVQSWRPEGGTVSYGMVFDTPIREHSLNMFHSISTRNGDSSLPIQNQEDQVLAVHRGAHVSGQNIHTPRDIIQSMILVAKGLAPTVEEESDGKKEKKKQIQYAKRGGKIFKDDAPETVYLTNLTTKLSAHALRRLSKQDVQNLQELKAEDVSIEKRQLQQQLLEAQDIGDMIAAHRAQTALMRLTQWADVSDVESDIDEGINSKGRRGGPTRKPVLSDRSSRSTTQSSTSLTSTSSRTRAESSDTEEPMLSTRTREESTLSVRERSKSETQPSRPLIASTPEPQIVLSPNPALVSISTAKNGGPPAAATPVLETVSTAPAVKPNKKGKNSKKPKSSSPSSKASPTPQPVPKPSAPQSTPTTTA